jgi:hypothetical protein
MYILYTVDSLLHDTPSYMTMALGPGRAQCKIHKSRLPLIWLSIIWHSLLYDNCVGPSPHNAIRLPHYMTDRFFQRKTVNRWIFPLPTTFLVKKSVKIIFKKVLIGWITKNRYILINFSQQCMFLSTNILNILIYRKFSYMTLPLIWQKLTAPWVSYKRESTVHSY